MLSAPCRTHAPLPLHPRRPAPPPCRPRLPAPAGPPGRPPRAGADLLRIGGILGVGMVATLLFTAQVTVAIREAVKTPVIPVAKGKVGPRVTSVVG